ncbi:MAG: chloride channel protein [Acidobacteriota bacterium]
MPTALVVGVGTGFGALFFRWLIKTMNTLAFSGGKQVLEFLGPYYVALIPAAGGLVVGPLIYWFAREAKGHGVPEVMEAVALKGGRIRPVVVLIKTLASATCLGTGGAAGREGPIVQIGSAFGSTVGQSLRMSDDRIRMLVTCGAAGGIAATFNAPVAGVIFALEVILGEFAIRHFSAVVVSSVTASVIAQVFLGNAPAFEVPQYALQNPWELVLYVVLGVLAGVVGVGFIRMLYWTEDLFDAWRFPEYMKPALGGLGVGLIGVYAPQIFGVGYETIGQVLHGQLLFSTLVLLFLKMLATSLTLGSGGSGGIFAPSLFMGSMLGSAFGGVASRLLPGLVAPSGAYALVGMAAVFAAAAHAPITAIIILFEMTGDYRIILPLMLSTVISVLLAGRLETESIYTLKLARRGTRLQQGRDIDVMQGVRIAEVMTIDTAPVPASMKIGELVHHFQSHQRHAFPVVDQDHSLFGIVSLQDLTRALAGGETSALSAGDIATRSTVTVHPDEPMWVALQKLGPRDFSSLPVVDREDPHKLLGVVRRRDIVRAYNIVIMRRHEIQQRIDQMRLGRSTGAEFVEIPVSADSPVVGSTLAQLNLPKDCVIVAIRRNSKTVIPRGSTRLEAGDQITAFTEAISADALRRCLVRSAPKTSEEP